MSYLNHGHFKCQFHPQSHFFIHFCFLYYSLFYVLLSLWHSFLLILSFLRWQPRGREKEAPSGLAFIHCMFLYKQTNLNLKEHFYKWKSCFFFMWSFCALLMCLSVLVNKLMICIFLLLNLNAKINTRIQV